MKEATVSECGEIHPIKNDSNLETIGVGTKILINDAKGILLNKFSMTEFVNKL